ncbi:MAG: diguanylate cyclase [Pseudomonadota bacterium]
MEILERISEQMAMSPHPLFAITMAAVPCPDTPVILTLHWHGFIREKLAPLEEAEVVRYTPIPSSALQINDRWTRLRDLEEAALEAAWELGAWDLARAERPSCTRPGADSQEALECLQAFGAFPYGLHGMEVVVSEAPDADELLGLAARRGYLMWMFRPVHGGIWKEVAEDATLNPDGTREPPCPVEPLPVSGERARRTVYRFGQPLSQA